MAAAAPSPSQIQQTLGVLFDGFVLSMIGYGLTFFQTYVYFSQYPSDQWGQKSFVAAILSLDTVSTALVSKSIYFYMIGGLPYSEPLTHMDRSLNVHILLSVITVFGVQLYYALRIWKLSRNIPVTCITVLLSAFAFSLGLVMVAEILKEPLFERFSSGPLRAVSSLAFAFILLASLSIFSGLTHFLKFPTPRPTSLPAWFDIISRYLISRGLIVVMVQLACFVSLAASPATIYWIPLYIVATKGTINSLFNSRPARLGKGINEEDPVPNRTLRSRAGNSTASAPRFAMVSKMFDSGQELSNTTLEVEITRTIEFERALDEDSKGGYPDDRGDALQAAGATNDVVGNPSFAIPSAHVDE
ncbi:hypothetical protein DFH06DRAFT_1325899 [Mycena polygramma]|nr:hypothetical protein DFH06DRAFT_1325899 [Mycena polygramma]